MKGRLARHLRSFPKVGGNSQTLLNDALREKIRGARLENSRTWSGAGGGADDQRRLG
jgi:hypothetical protein